MKVFDKKLDNPDPFAPEMTERIIEVIRSMSPEELRAFLDYRTPGVEETWLGQPIPQARKSRRSKTATAKKATSAS